MSDTEIQTDLDAGMTVADVARKHGVTYQAVYYRIKNNKRRQVEVSVRDDQDRRVVGDGVNAIEILTRAIERESRVSDACDEYLRDPDDPTRYDVGPRASELNVIYEDYEMGADDKPIVIKRKDTLQAIINHCEEKLGIGIKVVETKHADPRELVIKAHAEIRQTVDSMAALLDKLFNARVIRLMREAVIKEIDAVEPESARRIADAVDRAAILWSPVGDHASSQHERTAS